MSNSFITTDYAPGELPLPPKLQMTEEEYVSWVLATSADAEWVDGEVVSFAPYEEFGIREYWIIDPQAQSFEVYLLDSTGKYQQIKVTDGVIYSNVISGFWVKSEWFAPATRVSELEALRQLGVA